MRNALIAILLVSVVGFASEAQAQVMKVTYTLDDVWLLPDVSHPTAGPQLMSGSFEWTYSVGDFENGTGELISAGIPWFGLGLEWVDATFDSGAAEFTLAGNYHDTGLDVTLSFLTPLSPTGPSSIDPTRSNFDIQQGISHKGHAISGSVIPGTPTDECVIDSECDDGLFCNGAETCDAGTCVAGIDPCPGEVCDEAQGQCMPGGGCQAVVSSPESSTFAGAPWLLLLPGLALGWVLRRTQKRAL